MSTGNDPDRDAVARAVQAARLPQDATGPMIEIKIRSTRKIVGDIVYVVLYLAVAVGLIIICSRFTASILLAVILVVFMVGYMLLMMRWASRNMETRDRR